MRKPSKKVLAVLTAAALLAGGGTAFAYWTAGGTGTGTAAAGTNTPMTAVQVTTVSDLRPGGVAQTISGNFTNPAANGPVWVTSVTASIASVSKAVSAPSGTCDATDFTLATPVMTVGAQVAAGTAQGSWTGATIAFNNKPAANQDGCKGATVNLSYSIS